MLLMQKKQPVTLRATGLIFSSLLSENDWHLTSACKSHIALGKVAFSKGDYLSIPSN